MASTVSSVQVTVGPMDIPSNYHPSSDPLDSHHPSHDYSVSGSFHSSPRQYPSDVSQPILEEEIGESGSESPIEPVTPANLPVDHPTPTPTKAALNSPPTSDQTTPRPAEPQLTRTSTSAATESDDANATGTLSRRSTRGSTSSFRRTMSMLFRRSASSVERDTPVFDSNSPTSSDVETFMNGGSSRPAPPTSAPRDISNPPQIIVRQSTSSTTPSSTTPDSPLEMAGPNRSSTLFGKSLPTPDDFNKKKRTSTGFTLRSRAANLVGRANGRPKVPRRASSFDAGNNRPVVAPTTTHEGTTAYPPERLPWALAPDAGTGAKARRMSLSLPDDFTVDVADLLSEFEYQHKLLGRHGKHLGKGAASKVTLMARKGCPGELYAVKEFRGKSNRESQDDYDKKIKSEFSIAKSLHHPNIVETIRLCTDHGRWNHVMEYCAEGDLFALVQKGWLKGEQKLKDRLCLFKQLVQGVAYLHENGIAHRDIKLENLLMTKDSKLKITDFGVSEVFSGTHPGLREAGGQCGQNMMGEVRLCAPGICGSEPYIAPEVLAKMDEYDPRALDVWSSAIIMIYMTFGGAIWTRAEPGNMHYDKLVKGWQKWTDQHPEPDATITETDYPKCYALDFGVNPPALRRILLQMLHPNPRKRISIAEVNNYRWMKNVECCQLESYEEQALTIDATKKDGGISKGISKKIFCHSHLPPKTSGSHSLGKMPGQAGY
ncbi:Putative Serine/threonine-protein kinase HAL4/SAT4 [[Torrubiella] hemipterigena]|uniref:non-specific serine/threonine protein kinase n=1 Tax=[Torrubiella] hemipterigena TaxID=1531966 RepID=A0A0A1TL24_9HYPO|nr:Putative Serine/threonine-protein kinase HAL4/SAT4 [[Torrubiella] hemipterigena]